jgi:hypothetical protein
MANVTTKVVIKNQNLITTMPNTYSLKAEAKTQPKISVKGPGTGAAQPEKQQRSPKRIPQPAGFSPRPRR